MTNLWDSSPVDWGSGSFGEIVTTAGPHGNRRYQITALDTIYLGAIANWEGGGNPALALWSVIQRFGGTSMRQSYRRFMESFSAPVMPAFWFDGAPRPERASVPCNTIRDRRNRLLYPNVSGGGPATGGSLPQAGQNGIPGRPREWKWNQVQCTSGQSGVDLNILDYNLRTERYRRIRSARYGSSPEERAQGWRETTGGGTRGNQVRQSVYLLVTGRLGNAIPGFDNWKACRAVNLNRRRNRGPEEWIVDLSGLTVSGFNQAVTQWAETIRGQGRPLSEVFADFVPEGAGNCFLYRTVLRTGRVDIEWNGPDQVYLSQNASADYSHLGHGSITAPSGSTAVGGTVSTTYSGLAPTAQRPSGSAGSGVNAVPVLPSGEEIHASLEEWADRMEVELVRTFGVGRRR